MAETEFVTFTRRDGRPITIRKQSVAAFAPSPDGDLTLVWLAGRGSEEYIAVQDLEEDVARGLGAA